MHGEQHRVTVTGDGCVAHVEVGWAPAMAATSTEHTPRRARGFVLTCIYLMLHIFTKRAVKPGGMLSEAPSGLTGQAAGLLRCPNRTSGISHRGKSRGTVAFRAS